MHIGDDYFYFFMCVCSGSSLQDWATDPDRTSKDKEEEERNEEAKIEKDDAEKLSKMRNWDDWKDGEFHCVPLFSFLLTLFLVLHFRLGRQTCSTLWSVLYK